MPVDIPVREDRKCQSHGLSAQYQWSSVKRLPKKPRETLSAEIHAPYKLFKPTTMDTTRFLGTTRTNYKSGLTIISPSAHPATSKPDDGQRAVYDRGSFISGPLKSWHYLVFLVLAVGVFHCDNINETLDRCERGFSMVDVRSWDCRLYSRKGGQLMKCVMGERTVFPGSVAVATLPCGC